MNTHAFFRRGPIYAISCFGFFLLDSWHGKQARFRDVFTTSFPIFQTLVSLTRRRFHNAWHACLLPSAARNGPSCSEARGASAAGGSRRWAARVAASALRQDAQPPQPSTAPAPAGEGLERRKFLQVFAKWKGMKRPNKENGVLLIHAKSKGGRTSETGVL